MRVPIPPWGRRGIPSPRCDTNPLTPPEQACYYPHRSNTNSPTLRRKPTPREAHPAHQRGLNVQAHPNGPRAGPRLKQTPPSPLTGPRAPFPDPRRWKTPWTVIVPMAPFGALVPWSGTGRPVAEDRSALRPLPKIKLGCPPLPAPGYRRRTGYPVLLRGELTLDFPLPASAYGGQRSQPLLEPMTDDGPVRPTILPGLGGGGAPSPRSRDAFKPALSKDREPNPASVFHRQPKTQQTERKPKPHNRRWIRLWRIRLWRTEEKASVSLTYRTSTSD